MDKDAKMVQIYLEYGAKKPKCGTKTPDMANYGTKKPKYGR